MKKIKFYNWTNNCEGLGISSSSSKEPLTNLNVLRRGPKNLAKILKPGSFISVIKDSERNETQPFSLAVYN